MKRHERLHQGLKPFQCQFCQRAFSRQDALNRHLKADGNAPCCGRKSVDKSYVLPEAANSQTAFTKLHVSAIPEPSAHSLDLEQLQEENSNLRLKIQELQANEQTMSTKIKELEIEKALLQRMILSKNQ